MEYTNHYLEGIVADQPHLQILGIHSDNCVPKGRGFGFGLGPGKHCSGLMTNKLSTKSSAAVLVKTLTCSFCRHSAMVNSS